MPLTKRQKRRLLEVSKMIESSIVVKDDMEDIQLEYVQEIDNVVEQILLSFKQSQENQIENSSELLAPPRRRGTKNISKFRNVRKQRERIREARKYVPPPKPAVAPAPEWAKRLWRRIAKKCHPDRLSFTELTAIQIARRQAWFLEAKLLFEQRNWPKMIHIGVQVGEYVDNITHKEQLSWLNAEYENISGKIKNIHESLAWSWGTNWENIDVRIKIATTVLKHRGVEVPPRQDLIEILLKLELD